MATVTLWLIVAMVLLNAAVWMSPDLSLGGFGFEFSASHRSPGGAAMDAGSMPAWQRAGAMVWSTVPLLALLWGLHHLRLLFRAYGRKAYFSTAAAEHLGKMGRAVGLWVALDLLCQPLLGLWLTMQAPAGERILGFGIGSQDLVALFLAACIMVIARILRRASELQAENQQFV